MAEPLRLIDLPSTVVRPEGIVISRKAHRARARMARREFVRVTAIAAVGTGLAFAGLFPTARPAYATHPGTVWNGCYDGPFAGATGCCACGSFVNRGYCAGGWHRHDTIGGGIRTEYRRRRRSCGGVANAWYWRRNGNRWRCSDGKMRTCTPDGCGAWSKTVCPKRV